MKNIKVKLRLGRLAAVCISTALLFGAMSGLTYAATGGETINPVKAVKVYVNGSEYDVDLKDNGDGSYTVHMNDGDSLDVVYPDGSVQNTWLCAESETGGINVTFSSDENGDERSAVSSIDILPGDSDDTMKVVPREGDSGNADAADSEKAQEGGN